jgi:large conductance mechanosensitive channel
MDSANAPKKKGIIEEFKEFALKGSVLDMAVGVVIGAAFNAIVQSFVEDIITPIIGVIAHTESIAKLSMQVGPATFTYGAFIASIIHFFLVAVAVFVMVKVINKFRLRNQEEKEADKPTEAELLAEIRDLLKEERG